jgi:hypothetical protein
MILDPHRYLRDPLELLSPQALHSPWIYTLNDKQVQVEWGISHPEV